MSIFSLHNRAQSNITMTCDNDNDRFNDAKKPLPLIKAVIVIVKKLNYNFEQLLINMNCHELYPNFSINFDNSWQIGGNSCKRNSR